MDARRWHYERCHWYFVCVLPLSYLVTFSNRGFQFVTEVETSKNKNSEGLWFWGFFHHSREESLVWVTCFICQKNITYHLQIGREEMTIVCGFWPKHDQSLSGLRADVSMLCSGEPSQWNFPIFITKYILNAHFYAQRIGNRAGNERK